MVDRGADIGEGVELHGKACDRLQPAAGSGGKAGLREEAAEEGRPGGRVPVAGDDDRRLFEIALHRIGGGGEIGVAIAPLPEPARRFRVQGVEEERLAVERELQPERLLVGMLLGEGALQLRLGADGKGGEDLQVVALAAVGTALVWIEPRRGNGLVPGLRGFLQHDDIGLFPPQEVDEDRRVLRILDEEIGGQHLQAAGAGARAARSRYVRGRNDRHGKAEKGDDDRLDAPRHQGGDREEDAARHHIGPGEGEEIDEPEPVGGQHDHADGEEIGDDARQDEDAVGEGDRSPARCYRHRLFLLHHGIRGRSIPVTGGLHVPRRRRCCNEVVIERGYGAYP